MSRMHNPAHPGEVLREWLPENMTVTEAAIRLQVSRVMLSKILNDKAGVSADMAIRLSKDQPRSMAWYAVAVGLVAGRAKAAS
jgi:addiction module HigA family antidote